MFEMTDEEYREWGGFGKPTDALLELFVLCGENGYERLVNNQTTPSIFKLSS